MHGHNFFPLLVNITKTFTVQSNKGNVKVHCKQTDNTSDIILNLKAEYNLAINNNITEEKFISCKSINFSYSFDCGSSFVLLVTWSKENLLCNVKEINETTPCSGTIILNY